MITDKDFNKNRDRRYGLRIGDLVDCFAYKIKLAEVVGFEEYDNNRVYIKEVGSDKQFNPPAEWCKIIMKVEDRKLGEIIEILELTETDFDTATAIMNPVERALLRQFPEARTAFVSTETILLDFKGGRGTFKGEPSNFMRGFIRLWNNGEIAKKDFTPLVFQLHLTLDKWEINEQVLSEVLNLGGEEKNGG